jgi:hypothetical protein
MYRFGQTRLGAQLPPGILLMEAMEHGLPLALGNSRRYPPTALRVRTAHRMNGFRGTGSSITTSVASTGAGAAASYGAGVAAGAAGITGGALLGTVVPIVGSIVGALIGGLLSGHFAREKGAKNENAALNQVMPAIVTDIKSVFTAANNGQISASDAVTALQTIQSNYWQAVSPYESGPGQHAIACTGTSTPCNKQCTASCCVGCNHVNNWIAAAIAVFQRGGGTAQFVPSAGSKYGYTGVPAWSATYKAPPQAAASSLLSTAGVSTPVFGFPLWVWLAGGLGLFLVMR